MNSACHYFLSTLIYPRGIRALRITLPDIEYFSLLFITILIVKILSRISVTFTFVSGYYTDK